MLNKNIHDKTETRPRPAACYWTTDIRTSLVPESPRPRPAWSWIVETKTSLVSGPPRQAAWSLKQLRDSGLEAPKYHIGNSTGQLTYSWKHPRNAVRQLTTDLALITFNIHRCLSLWNQRHLENDVMTYHDIIHWDDLDVFLFRHQRHLEDDGLHGDDCL